MDKQENSQSSWSTTKSTFTSKKCIVQSSQMSEPQITQQTSSSTTKSSNSFSNNSRSNQDFECGNLNRVGFSSDRSDSNSSLRKAVKNSSSTSSSTAVVRSSSQKEDNLTYEFVKRADGRTEIQVTVTARDFAPDELLVKLVENTLTITGKHEERSKSSYSAKSFHRMCAIPSGIGPEDLNCSLDACGRLLITALMPENDKSSRSSKMMTTTTMSSQVQQLVSGGKRIKDKLTSSGASTPLGDNGEQAMTLFNNQIVEENRSSGRSVVGGEQVTTTRKTVTMKTSSQQRNVSNEWVDDTNFGSTPTSGMSTPASVQSSDQILNVLEKQLAEENRKKVGRTAENRTVAGEEETTTTSSRSVTSSAKTITQQQKNARVDQTSRNTQPESPQSLRSPKSADKNQTTSITTTTKSSQLITRTSTSPDQDDTTTRVGSSTNVTDTRTQQSKKQNLSNTTLQESRDNEERNLKQSGQTVGSKNQQQNTKTTTTTTKTATMVPSMEDAPGKGIDLKRDIQLTYEFVTREDKKIEIQILVTVRGFSVEDLQVKLVDNVLTITGDHQETYSGKSFTRTCTIPTGITAEDLNCSFDTQGRLLITALVPDVNHSSTTSKTITETETTRQELQKNTSTDVVENDLGYLVTSPMSDMDDSTQREFQTQLTTQTTRQEQRQETNTTTSFEDLGNVPSGASTPSVKDRDQPATPVSNQNQVTKDSPNKTEKIVGDEKQVNTTASKVTTSTTIVQTQQQQTNTTNVEDATNAPKVADTTAPKVANTTAPKVADTPAPQVADTPAPQVADTPAPKVVDTPAPKVVDTTAPKVSTTTPTTPQAETTIPKVTTTTPLADTTAPKVATTAPVADTTKQPMAPVQDQTPVMKDDLNDKTVTTVEDEKNKIVRSGDDRTVRADEEITSTSTKSVTSTTKMVTEQVQPEKNENVVESPKSPQAPQASQPNTTNQTTSTKVATQSISTEIISSSIDKNDSIGSTTPDKIPSDTVPQNQNAVVPSSASPESGDGTKMVSPRNDQTVDSQTQTQQQTTCSKTTTTTTAKTMTMVAGTEGAPGKGIDLKKDIQMTYEYVTREDKKTEIQILVTTRGFSSKELQVKLVDNVLTITGDHQETYSGKSFTRTCTVPTGIKPEDLVCTFDTQERLLITALVPDVKDSSTLTKTVTTATETKTTTSQQQSIQKNTSTDLVEDNAGYLVTSPMSDVDESKQTDFQTMLTTQTTTRQDQQQNNTTTSIEELSNAPSGANSPSVKAPDQPMTPSKNQSPVVKDDKSKTGKSTEQEEEVTSTTTTKNVTKTMTTVQQSQQQQDSTLVDKSPAKKPELPVAPNNSSSTTTTTTTTDISESLENNTSVNEGVRPNTNPTASATPEGGNTVTGQPKSSTLVNKTQQEIENETRKTTDQTNLTQTFGSGIQQQQQTTTKTSTTKTSSIVQGGGGGPNTGIDLARDIQLNCDYVKRTDGRMEFQVLVTTRGFSAKELQVKLVETTLTITGNHQEEYSGKSFYRECSVPSGILPKDLNCTYDSSGRLLITAIIPEVGDSSKNTSTKTVTKKTSMQRQERIESSDSTEDKNRGQVLTSTDSGVMGENRTDLGRTLEEDEQTSSSRQTVPSSSTTKTSQQQQKNLSSTNTQQFQNLKNISSGENLDQAMTLTTSQITEENRNNFGNSNTEKTRVGGAEMMTTTKTVSTVTKTSKQQQSVNNELSEDTDGGSVVSSGFNTPSVDDNGQTMCVFNNQTVTETRIGGGGTNVVGNVMGEGETTTTTKTVTSTKKVTQTFKVTK